MADELSAKVKEPKMAAKAIASMGEEFYLTLLTIARSEWTAVQFAEFNFELAKLVEKNDSNAQGDLINKLAVLVNPVALAIILVHNEECDSK